MRTPYEPGAAVSSGTVPLSVPSIRGNAWDYVKQCLDTNWVSSAGPFVDRFEKMCAEYAGRPHAVATSTGTAALHTAMMIAGIGPDDAVLVSDLTFIASVNAIRYVGATPIFVDVEPEYAQVDVNAIRTILANECQRGVSGLIHQPTGKRVRALVPVHVLGHPVDLDPILALAKEYDLLVIEDAAEALGASYKNRHIGGHGDIVCYSFNGNKIITTGGGGMIVTSNPDWAKKARYLTTQAKDDPLEYIHHETGYNYRLTNLQAGLGCAQMEVLDEFVTAKRAIAARYRDGLAGIPGIETMPEAPWATSTYWMYTIRVRERDFGLSSRQLLRTLEEAKIQTRPLWQPMHLSPSQSDLPKRPCPVSAQWAAECLSLPCSVDLTLDDQQRVISAIRSASQSIRHAA